MTHQGQQTLSQSLTATGTIDVDVVENVTLSNLYDCVPVSSWLLWFRSWLMSVDDNCNDLGHDANAMLLAIRKLIDDRLQRGSW